MPRLRRLWFDRTPAIEAAIGGPTIFQHLRPEFGTSGYSLPVRGHASYSISKQGVVPSKGRPLSWRGGKRRSFLFPRVERFADMQGEIAQAVEALLRE